MSRGIENVRFRCYMSGLFLFNLERQTQCPTYFLSNSSGGSGFPGIFFCTPVYCHFTNCYCVKGLFCQDIRLFFTTLFCFDAGKPVTDSGVPTSPTPVSPMICPISLTPVSPTPMFADKKCTLQSRLNANSLNVQSRRNGSKRKKE